MSSVLAPWVLIVFAHVGAMGGGNSNALTTAYFESKAACVYAGSAVKSMAKGTVKEITYTCVPTK